MKVSNHSGFRCPYCREVSAIHEPSAVPDAGGRLDCDDCGKTFVGWVETDVVFYTCDIEGGEMLKNLLHNIEDSKDG